MYGRSFFPNVKIRDVEVDGETSLIITCPECGHEGWCYPGQAVGKISIVCDNRACTWHETHNWWNRFFAQMSREAVGKLKAGRYATRST